MKKHFSFGLCAMMLLAAIAHAQTATAVGSWDITIDSPQGQRKGLLVIKQDGDKLTAMMKSPRGERPLDSVAIKGSEITMTMTVNAQGQDLVVTYKGKIEADKMGGEADFGGFATGTWSAVPHKEDAAAAAPAAPATPAAPAMPADAANVSGVWDVKVETPGGPGTPVFTLKQDGEKITGTYKGQFGESPISGTIKGGDIQLTLKIAPQGEDIVITYTGKLTAKDTMGGKAVFGTFGEGTWTAKKK